MLIVENIHEVSSVYSIVLLNKLNLSINQYKSYKKISYNGTIYRCQDYLTIFDFYNNVELFKIKEIVIIIENQHVLFVCTNSYEINYESHFQSYSVSEINCRESIHIKNIDAFSGPPIKLHKIVNRSQMIKLKCNY